MIVFIEGIIEEAAPLSAVISVQGIGYRVHIPVTTAEKLPPRGEKVRLHTLAVYREDSQALYGFMQREERDFFQLLTEKVSGVGPKIALNILSRLSLEMLRSAIISGDAALLSKCQGIGRKTAERLCIELKDHMPKGLAPAAGDAGGSAGGGGTPNMVPSRVRDAVAALMQLGYKLDLADKSVSKAVQKLGSEATTEALIKEALK